MNWRLSKSSDMAYTWYELNWPANLDAKQVATFLRALNSAYVSKGMRFVVRSTTQEIRHFAIVPAQNVQNVLRLLNNFLPEIEAAETEPFDILAPVAFKLKMSTKNRVLNTEQPEIVSNIILTALSNVHTDECIVLEWVLGATRSPVSISSAAMHFETTSHAGILLESFIRSPKQLDGQSHASMQAKHGVPSWRAVLFVGIGVTNSQRGQYLINQMAYALRSAQAPGVGLGLRLTYPVCMDISYKPFFWSLININELTGLLAWPLGNQAVHGIQRATNRHLSLPNTIPIGSRILAVSNVAGSNQALTLSPADGLTHTHVIGPTGSGKSTLLLNLIVQDIQQDRGVIAVDPKGDLINDVLKRIPANRRNDVVLIDPSDATCPVGLNPLARRNQPAALIADDILAVFRGLYGSNFGPRTQDILHAGLLTLCSNSGMSLCTLPILYTNPAFRNRLVAKLNDPLGLGSFWSWFNTLSEAERNRVLAPVMNKLRAFLLRPAMRRVIGQGRPKFDMKEIISGKKIVLVNLAKGTLGAETSKLFGSLVISQVWQAIQGRISMPMNERKPIFVYVDEIQDYLHLPTDIGDVLAQSRGYGMGMVLAHQHLAQLPSELRSGVLSNARSRICFQLSHEDALVMSRSSKILSPSDFENLSRYNVYARLVANGQVLPWVSGKTLEPIEQISNPAVVKVLSRNRYGRDGAVVDAELTAQIEGGKVEMPVSVIGRKSKTEAES